MSKRKTARPDVTAMMTAAEKMPAPRNREEWREVSRALRMIRREAQRQGRHCTPHVPCPGWYRRIELQTDGPLVSVYNGPSPIGDVLMIRFHREQHMRGIGTGRLADARVFAARSRKGGPIPLPR